MFGCEVVSDWKPGDDILYKEIRDGKEIVHVKGKILDIKPGKLLKHTTFGPQSGLEDIESNYLVVTYELFEEKDSTLFSVTQENFGNNEQRYNDSKQGWDFVFNGIKQLLEE